MSDHLLAPGKGIPTVMPHAGKQSGIGQLEIFQETIRGDRIRQSNSVQNAILFHPGIQGIPVGICRIVLVIALPGTHDPFMRHGTHRCHIPFFRQKDIGSTDAGRILIVLIVRHQLLHRQFLCLRGQAAPQAKFTEVA